MNNLNKRQNRDPFEGGKYNNDVVGLLDLIHAIIISINDITKQLFHRWQPIQQRTG